MAVATTISQMSLSATRMANPASAVVVADHSDEPHNRSSGLMAHQLLVLGQRYRLLGQLCAQTDVISATLPRKRVVPPPHRCALHRRRRASSLVIFPGKLVERMHQWIPRCRRRRQPPCWGSGLPECRAGEPGPHSAWIPYPGRTSQRVRRGVVDVGWGSHLLDTPLVQHGNSIGHVQRLGLIVGDQHRQFLATLTVHTNKINPALKPRTTSANSMTNSNPVVVIQ